MSIIKNSMRNLLNMKQKEGETVVDYSKQFEAAQDVMLNHLSGNLVLTKMIEVSKYSCGQTVDGQT